MQRIELCKTTTGYFQNSLFCNDFFLGEVPEKNLKHEFATFLTVGFWNGVPVVCKVNPGNFRLVGDRQAPKTCAAVQIN